MIGIFSVVNPQVVDNDSRVNRVALVIKHWPDVSQYPRVIKSVILIDQHSQRLHCDFKSFSALKNSYQTIFKNFPVLLFKGKLFGLSRGRSFGNRFSKFIKSQSIPSSIQPSIIHLENLMQNGLDHGLIDAIDVRGYMLPKIVLVKRWFGFRQRIQKCVKIVCAEMNQVLNRRIS